MGEGLAASFPFLLLPLPCGPPLQPHTESASGFSQGGGLGWGEEREVRVRKSHRFCLRYNLMMVSSGVHVY